MARTTLLFLLALLSCPITSRPQVVLSEVMFDPAGSEWYDEFVELCNVGAEAIDLGGWRLGDQDELDEIIDAGAGTLLLPGQFAIVLDPGYFDHSTSYDTLIPPTALILTIDDGAFGKAGFSNSNPETIYLISPAGDTVGAYRYTLDNPPGYSDEKIDLTAGDDPENWANSRRPGGSPGAPNTVRRRDFDLSVRALERELTTSNPRENVVIHVEVANEGGRAAGNASLRLYWDRNADGRAVPAEILRERAVAPPAPGAAAQDTFTFRAIGPGLYLLRVQIVLPGDEEPSNDTDSLLVAAPAEPEQVLVNEIYYRPASGEPEWVELYNAGTDSVNLAGWSVKDATASGCTPLPMNAATHLLPPGAYVVVTEDSTWPGFAELGTAGAIQPRGGFPSLNNSGDSVVVIDPLGQRIDALFYRPSWGGENGVSLVRIRPDRPSNDPENWASSAAPSGSTPGHKNSVTPPDTDLALVRVEVSDNRSHPGGNLSVRIANVGLREVRHFAVDWAVIANITCQPQPGPSGTLSASNPLVPLDTVELSAPWEPLPPGWARIHAALRTADERPQNDTLTTDVFVPPESAAVVINEIQFDPPVGEPEWVEVINRSPYRLSLDGWLFGDRHRRVPLDSIGLCLDPGGLGLIAADTLLSLRDPAAPIWSTLGPWPGLNNSSDAVVLCLPTGQLIDTVVYRSSWRRSREGSLERILPAGDGLDSTNWAACLDPRGATPGEINSVAPREVDLSLDSLSAPRTYWPDSRTLELWIRNRGAQPSASARVRLRGETETSPEHPLLDWEAQAELPPLPPAGLTSVRVQVDIPAPGWYRVQASLNCPGDGRAWNDTISTPLYISPPRASVVFNEFYPVPLEDEHEWVEVVNTSPWDLQLRGWHFADRRGLASAATVARPFLLRSGAFGLLCSDSLVWQEWPEVSPELGLVLPGWPSLNDEGDELLLLDPNGLVIDSLSYGQETDLVRGYSLEKLSPAASSSDPHNWIRCTLSAGATPGAANSVSGEVRTRGPLMQLRPDPFSPDGDGRDDVLLVSVHLPVPVATLRVRIFDLLGRPVRTLADNERSGPVRVLVWDGCDDEGVPCPPGAYLVSLRWWGENGGSGASILPVALFRP